MFSLVFIVLNPRIGLITFFIGLILTIVPFGIQLRNRNQSRMGIPVELNETWELIRWMAIRRELNHRTHPELRALLEEIAAIRKTTLDALASDAWKARSKIPEGAQAIKDIEAVLREAIYDSIFIGRHLFRGKGQREATFAKRCGDPKFGRHALESIGQIRDEMRLLSESALAASTQSDLRVNLVKQRLDALVDAERELETVSQFDATD